MVEDLPAPTVQEQRDETDPYKFDRPRGVLTKRDRKWLCGASDVEPKSHHERQIRSQIRNRVFHSQLDYAILAYNFAERDRDILRDNHPSVHSAAKHQIAFQLFLSGFRYPALLEPIKDGIQRGMWRDGYHADVDIDLNVRFNPADPIPDGRLQNLDERITEVSEKRLRDWLFGGIITNEQFAEEIQRRRAAADTEE